VWDEHINNLTINSKIPNENSIASFKPLNSLKIKAEY
jgi:hypothetical protein